jgi:hypothetical protein
VAAAPAPAPHDARTNSENTHDPALVDESKTLQPDAALPEKIAVEERSAYPITTPEMRSDVASEIEKPNLGHRMAYDDDAVNPEHEAEPQVPPPGDFQRGVYG